jgi:aspartate carbamoyltransferase regulatory subunit
MKDTLVIRRIKQGYVVDYSKTRDAVRIYSLFNTVILPTPYTAQANVDTVLAAIAKLNPEYNVVIS